MNHNKIDVRQLNNAYDKISKIVAEVGGTQGAFHTPSVHVYRQNISLQHANNVSPNFLLRNGYAIYSDSHLNHFLNQPFSSSYHNICKNQIEQLTGYISDIKKHIPILFRGAHMLLIKGANKSLVFEVQIDASKFFLPRKKPDNC